MKKALNYLKKIDGWLYLIWFFCFVGLFRNVYHIYIYGFDYGSIATKVFIAMIVIYLSQLILIPARERNVWIISAIQVFFCFYVYEDFTFLPIINMIKGALSAVWPQMDLGWAMAVSMAFMSGMFCLEIAKTYLLCVLTNPLRKKKKAPAKDGKEVKAQAPAA